MVGPRHGSPGMSVVAIQIALRVSVLLLIEHGTICVGAIDYPVDSVSTPQACGNPNRFMGVRVKLRPPLELGAIKVPLRVSALFLVYCGAIRLWAIELSLLGRWRFFKFSAL